MTENLVTVAIKRCKLNCALDVQCSREFVFTSRSRLWQQLYGMSWVCSLINKAILTL